MSSPTGSVVIRSTGMYVPEIEVPNDVLRARFAKTAPEYIDKMEATTGIKTRWYAPDDWATSDLAVRAARQALTRAAVSPEDVDMIVLGTDSPDYMTPATSVVVQHKLGSPKAGTFDVGCACASFPTALAAANGLMTTNPWMQNVLVIGAYMMHKLADPEDQGIFFYGDGAGAALLQRSAATTTPSLLASAYRADGAYSKHWGIYSGGTAEPASVESIEAGRTNVRMVEKYPAEINDTGWPAVVNRLSEINGFAVNDIDLVIFTQVRKRTIDKAMVNLGLPNEKAHTVMGKWGYTGSACIPMALHDAIVNGRVKTGDLVVLVGSGVGHNQAGIAVRITDDLVRKAV
ncbi:MAG: 3-oxoacyl-[acyl-carrier-protein] synthase [Labilithrix sp.]|nr:3-oxoacyl-[acyl-carrier-protein] synthase [Labilithrix sp.]